MNVWMIHDLQYQWTTGRRVWLRASAKTAAQAVAKGLDVRLCDAGETPE